jgi:HK97 family phage major capsid protein
VDELASAFEQFKAANDEALKQKADLGAIDALTESKLARLDGELDRLRDGLDRTRASLNRSAREALGMAGEDPAAPEHKAAFRAYLRTGDAAELARIERKTLSVGADPEGGYLVTPEVSDRIVSTIFETSPVRALAAVESISTDSLELLVDKADAGAGWVAETEARAETTSPDLAKINIPVHEIYAEPRATQKLIDDSSIDIETWLTGKVADKFARTEATAFVNGTGVGQPRGFLTYPAGTDWGQIEQVNSGGAGVVKADGLIDLQHSLKEGYGANAVWLVNRLVVRDIRKLKDSQNQYLWEPGLKIDGHETLLGRPIHTATDMPVAAADSLSVAYGDFGRAYQVVDRVGVRVLRDPFTAKPYVKFYTTKRVGGDVVNFEAIKLQKLAA